MAPEVPKQTVPPSQAPSYNPLALHSLPLLGRDEKMNAIFESFALRLGRQIDIVEAHTRRMDDIAERRATFGAAFDNAMSVILATTLVSGQQTVSPEALAGAIIPRLAGATQTQQPAGAVYPPIRNVDQTGAAATGAVLSALAGQAVNADLVNAIAAQVSTQMQPVIDAAVGKAVQAALAAKTTAA